MQPFLLASSSRSRQELLKQMDIPFKVVAQQANEEAVDTSLPIHELVKAIAVEKMNHVVMPTDIKHGTVFVLTADTLGKDSHGVIHGKPRDKHDAIAKLKALRGGGTVYTAFCLDKKQFANQQWQVVQRELHCIQTDYVFDISDSWIESYLQHTPNYMHISGALMIEGYGAQFVKTVNGSYSAVLGLPLYELRQALERSGFFNQD